MVDFLTSAPPAAAKPVPEQSVRQSKTFISSTNARLALGKSLKRLTFLSERYHLTHPNSRLADATPRRRFDDRIRTNLTHHMSTHVRLILVLFQLLLLRFRRGLERRGVGVGVKG